jgi:hypothetical protein
VELIPASPGVRDAIRGGRAVLRSTGPRGAVWAVFERADGSWSQMTGALTAEQLEDWRQHVSARGLKPTAFEVWLSAAVEHAPPQDDVQDTGTDTST